MYPLRCIFDLSQFNAINVAIFFENYSIFGNYKQLYLQLENKKENYYKLHLIV